MKIKLLLALLFAFLLLPKSTEGHSGPPFISINDVANLANPAGSGSVFFKVPNEIAANNFIVNDKLTFKIDTSLLPVDPSQVNSNDFIWDFANGKTGTGLSTTTSYSTSGSFIVILKVKDPNYQDPIELESMQINILPNKNSSPPQAKIKVNGKTIGDPFKEPVLIDKNSEVEFSAQDSVGKIKTYKWDFGDGSKLETGSELKHKFDFSQPYSYSFFPILRIEDENGVYADAVVQIASNEDSDSSTNPTNVSSGVLNQQNLIIGAVLIVSLAVVGFFVRTRFKSSSK